MNNITTTTLSTTDRVALGLALLLVALVALIVATIRVMRAWRTRNTTTPPPHPPSTPQQQPEPQPTTRDPEQGINGLNWWGAIYAPAAMIPAPPAIDAPLAVPMTPRELKAQQPQQPKPKPAPKREPTHCPFCVIQTCDEWGIPVDPARVIGTPVYCREHRTTILAKAKLGA